MYILLYVNYKQKNLTVNKQWIGMIQERRKREEKVTEQSKIQKEMGERRGTSVIVSTVKKLKE